MSSANALPTSDDTPPPLIVRWLRPQTASAYLDLPTAPITLSTQKEIPWQAFTAEESAACEAAWQALSNVERKRSEGLDVGGGEEGGEDGQNVRSNDKVVDEDTVGVSIARDKLFEVDVKRMQVSNRVIPLNRCCVVAYLFFPASSHILEDKRTSYFGS